MNIKLDKNKVDGINEHVQSDKDYIKELLDDDDDIDTNVDESTNEDILNPEHGKSTGENDIKNYIKNDLNLDFESTNDFNEAKQLDVTEEDKEKLGVKINKVVYVPWKLITLIILIILYLNPMKFEQVEIAKEFATNKISDAFGDIKEKMRIVNIVAKDDVVVTNSSDYSGAKFEKETDGKTKFTIDVDDATKNYYIIIDKAGIEDSDAKKTELNKLNTIFTAYNIKTSDRSGKSLKINIYDKNIIYNFKAKNECFVIRIGNFGSNATYTMDLDYDYDEFIKQFTTDGSEIHIRKEA